ncbi:unnamed protein product [Burkholderia pseudomallei]|nr:unnamed protein product [Burkholderia pseudomallei]
MSAYTFTLLFAVAIVAMTGTKLWLASRQVRFVAAHRARVPAQFRETIPLAAHQRAADYTIERTRLTMFEIVVASAVLVGLTLLGASARSIRCSPAGSATATASRWRSSPRCS